MKIDCRIWIQLNVICSVCSLSARLIRFVQWQNQKKIRRIVTKPQHTIATASKSSWLHAFDLVKWIDQFLWHNICLAYDIISFAYKTYFIISSILVIALLHFHYNTSTPFTFHLLILCSFSLPLFGNIQIKIHIILNMQFTLRRLFFLLSSFSVRLHVG